jgi:hypothetical protein
MSGDKKVILVTGGSGLVGHAIHTVIQEEDREDEDWIFVGSKDADLRYVACIVLLSCTGQVNSRETKWNLFIKEYALRMNMDKTVTMRISGNLDINRTRFNETLVKEMEKCIYLGI